MHKIMGRCKKHRRCRFLDNEQVFKPVGIPIWQVQMVELEPDEIEAMRLCDIENRNQIEAAEIMHISRGTVQRLLLSGRYKLMEAMLNSKAIKLKNSK